MTGAATLARAVTLLAALALSGCLSGPGAEPPPAPPRAWSFDGDGSASAGGPGQDYLTLAIGLPTEGRRCAYQATVRTVHRDAANYTLSVSGAYLDSHVGPAEPQVLPGSLLVGGDSLSRPSVGISAGGLHVQRNVTAGPGLGAEATADEVTFAGEVRASEEFYAGFGLRPVAQPVLVLFVVQEAPPGTQDMSLELAWTDCEVAWAFGALGDRLAVRAESFAGAASAVAGLPWVARDVSWSGGLQEPRDVRLWAARCPADGAGQACSMTVTPEGGAPVPVVGAAVEATRGAPGWTVAIDEAASPTDGGQILFFAAGLEPARLGL